MTDAVADPTPVKPLLEPDGGTPPLITQPWQYRAALDALHAASGPIAADVERASGFRYGQSAFLVQIRREGAGTFLLDPTMFTDLSDLVSTTGDAEWVFHAASQDLPSLRELGVFPPAIFDTELASRLLGFDKVGLGAVVTQLLGYELAKEHSAVDWSTRPLPEAWLQYAALDVELLIPLRNSLASLLQAARKDEWAGQEFEAVRTAAPPPARIEPWRRTSGLHRITQRRQLAVVRALWEERDRVARHRDLAPGRLLPDRAIIAAALHLPTSVPQLIALPEFATRATRARAASWQQIITQALTLHDDELPTRHGPPSDAPPPPKAWPERQPVAALRLRQARMLVASISEQTHTPVENLLQPDLLRRLCWTPPEQIDPTAIQAFLLGRGARPWQAELLAGGLSAEFTQIELSSERL